MPIMPVTRTRRHVLLSRPGRIGWLVAVAAFACSSAVLLPPIVQPAAYHAFADARVVFGIPNFWNALSNVPFLIVGIAGLHFVLLDPRGRSAFADARERWPYVVLFAGVALTGIGSAYYHLAPDNARLAWDRLPMTVGFMSIVAAMIVERIDRTAGLRLLAPLVVLGAASVFWWQASQAWGAENLRPYVTVQFGSIAIVLSIAALFPSRYNRASDIYAVIALYAAAKYTEHFDEALFSFGGVLSGHSLKHLLAAIAAYMILRMLKLRASTART